MALNWVLLQFCNRNRLIRLNHIIYFWVDRHFVNWLPDNAHKKYRHNPHHQIPDLHFAMSVLVKNVLAVLRQMRRE